MVSQVFNGIEVWRLCWPWENCDMMVFKPSLSQCRAVLGVTILLENDVVGSFAVKIEAGLKVVIQNPGVELCIHPPINPDCISSPFPHHTAPHHHRSSTKLHCPLHRPIAESLSWLLPSPFPTI